MGRSVTVLGAAALACVLAGAAASAITRSGGPGDDRLVGTNGADRLVGRGGSDHLIGHRGDDVLKGGGGPDVLEGGPGRDGFGIDDGEEIGSPGNDVIKARDGTPDEINCAGGYDVATVDKVEDGVYGCEKLKEPG